MAWAIDLHSACIHDPDLGPDHEVPAYLTYWDAEQEAKIYIYIYICIYKYIIGFLCVRPIIGQTWAQERAQRPRLEKRYINQRKSTRCIP